MGEVFRPPRAGIHDRTKPGGIVGFRLWHPLALIDEDLAVGPLLRSAALSPAVIASRTKDEGICPSCRQTVKVDD
jgi:hypothetical protein